MSDLERGDPAEGAPRLSSTAKRLSAIVLGGILAILIAVALDRVYGAIRSPSGGAEGAGPGLIFTPGERVRHITPEFAYAATINSLGFRGLEPQDSAFRIAAVGDSWVYGWGVNDDENWVSLLRDSLRQRLGEPRIDMLNLGAPGTSPSAYASIAERALPALKPKLVLVGVLQGQDLAQLWWETQTVPERLSTVSMREAPTLVGIKARGLLARIFPNFAALLSERARTRDDDAPDPATMSDSALAAYTLGGTRRQAAGVERNLSREGRRRFEALSRETRESFRRAEFNPAEVYYAVRQPDYYALTTRLETPRGRELVAELARHLGRIREAAERVGAATVVLSMPHGAYISESMCDSYRGFGFRCDSSFQSTNLADSATRLAARQAGIQHVIEVTEEFRAAADTSAQALFFRNDGHLTPFGNELYARLLVARIAALAAEPLGLQETAVRDSALP